MRIAFAGKTPAKIVNVGVEAQKKGQTELVPATTLRLKVTRPNNVLDMLDKKLRTFLFEKGSNAATQGTLDGVEPVSDLPQMTEIAKCIGDFGWDGEQTGCKLIVYQGVSKIVLSDGTVNKVKVHASEGGSVDLLFDFYKADLDAETLGELAVLHQHEVDVELELPEVLQKQIPDKKPKGEQDTPEKALARGAANEAGQKAA